MPTCSRNAEMTTISFPGMRTRSTWSTSTSKLGSDGPMTDAFVCAQRERRDDGLRLEQHHC